MRENVLNALRNPILVIDLGEHSYDLYYAIIDIIGKYRYNKMERKYEHSENEIYYKYHGNNADLEYILNELGFSMQYQYDESGSWLGGIYVTKKDN